MHVFSGRYSHCDWSCSFKSSLLNIVRQQLVFACRSSVEDTATVIGPLTLSSSGDSAKESKEKGPFIYTFSHWAKWEDFHFHWGFKRRAMEHRHHFVSSVDTILSAEEWQESILKRTPCIWSISRVVLLVEEGGGFFCCEFPSRLIFWCLMCELAVLYFLSCESFFVLFRRVLLLKNWPSQWLQCGFCKTHVISLCTVTS